MADAYVYVERLLSYCTTGPLLLVFTASLILFFRRARVPDRPPGPRGLPLVGNTFQAPLTHFGSYLKELHNQYGGLVYLNFNGQHTFSVGDLDLATELLERRSAIYSSRPDIPFLTRYADPEGFVFAMAKLGADSHFWGRKISTIIMKGVKAGDSEPLQRLEAIKLMQRLIADGGKDWYEQIGSMNARVTVAAMYGVSSVDEDAPQVAKVLELVEGTVTVINPTHSLINLAPIIDDLIPSFVPVPWRTSAKRWGQEDAAGWARLFRKSVEGERVRMRTWASVFSGYGEIRQRLLGTFATTRSALHAFVLASVLYPEWIEAAQQELDRVVGYNRLPEFRDRVALPFIEAIIREVIRWNPPGRIGIPHANTSEDVIKYGGMEYVIPKGSTIFCAPHVLEHDPRQFEASHVFRPQRFLDEAGQLKAEYRTTTFGFGRRLCPGIPFAERTLWISIASMLWTFNIRKTADPDTGVAFEYSTSDDAFDGGIGSGPLPFPVKFEPRSERHASVVKKEWEECEKDLTVLLSPAK